MILDNLHLMVWLVILMTLRSLGLILYRIIAGHPAFSAID